MSPLIKYTLGRIGLFLAALLVLWPVPVLSPLVKLLVALLVSFALSWFVLRGWREELAANLAEKMERRKQERERLRSALAGEDDDPAAGSAATPPGRDESA
ncbi:MAG: DUF4229 domain-containing protein [Natronosporangium sp.]